MPETVIVNCGEGTIERRELTPDEDAQRQKDIADHQRHQQVCQQEDAAREGVLTAMATKLGVPVDDLKSTLGVGRRQRPKDPQRQKLVDAHRAMRRKAAEETEDATA